MRKHQPCHACEYDYTSRCGLVVGFNQGCFAGKEDQIDCPACLRIVIREAEQAHYKRMERLKSQEIYWTPDDEDDESDD